MQERVISIGVRTPHIARCTYAVYVHGTPSSVISIGTSN